MQSRFILDISGIYIRTLVDQVHAQRNGLHGIDETRSTVEVGLLDVRPVLDQTLHHFQVGHEAGTPHGRRTRVRRSVQRRTQPDQTLDDAQFAGDGRAPQRRYPVDGIVFGHLEHALLLDVGVAYAN